MAESFEKEYDEASKKEVLEIYQNKLTKEDTVIHHGEGMEYDLKTIPTDAPDAKKRVEELEAKGWKVRARGQFIVLDRDHGSN